MLAAAAAVLLPLGLSLLMLHGLFFPEGRTVLAAWGPARVTAEGLSFALEAGTRTGACVLVLLLFSFTVSAPDLVAALAARGLPPQFGFVLASALTLLPAMAGRLEAIRAAQEARGLVVRGGVVSRLVAVRVQMVPLVLGLIEDAGSRAQALDARGFGSPGPTTSYREVQDPPAQRRFRAVLLVLAACRRGTPARGLLAGSGIPMTTGAPSTTGVPKTTGAPMTAAPVATPGHAVLTARIGSFTFHGDTDPALRDVEVSVRPGTLTAVLGGSGSGKTTLGKLLAGWLRPGQSGTLTGALGLAGELLEFRGGHDDPRINPAAWSGRVGYVPQDAAAMLSTVRSTVAEELAFGLENRGTARPDMLREVARIAELTGLAALLGRDPATLSGGELRRLAIACAVVTGPDVLVLDEPLASLDAAGVILVRDLIGRLTGAGTAVVVLEPGS